jgi:hypothetical protein
MYLCCYTYATPRLLGSSKPKRATAPVFDAGLREHRDLTSASCLLSAIGCTHLQVVAAAGRAVTHRSCGGSVDRTDRSGSTRIDVL